MPQPIVHAASELPTVTIDSYNVELRDEEGFLGDRASNRAFQGLLEDLRERLRQVGDDPLGDASSEKVSRETLDKLLQEGDPEAAGVVHGAIEDFAQELATVMRRFIRLKGWRDTERIVVGGGLRNSRVGELAIGRATVILKASGTDLTLHPIRHHPDEAGLIGAVHLAPSWMFANHDSLLAADIGGTNIRVGILELNMRQSPDLSGVAVWKSELWKHGAEAPRPSREAAVSHLCSMLKTLVSEANEHGFNLAPFIGIGCPGLIESNGSIKRGGQNLPGNWESAQFNLSQSIRESIPQIARHDTLVLMHNDAVVQGLSEIPFQQDVTRWGVLTIGTGLGNARFTNHASKDEPK